VFDDQKAQVAIRFFERMLTHTKGIYARKPFVLLDWQTKIISDIFGTIRSNGLRQYTTAYVEIPKKNGKTELAAGIALVGLLIDEEPGTEVYFAAASRDQASIGFKVAAQMVRNNPRLNNMCRIIDSTKTITLKADPNSFMRAISADAGTQDGINPHIAVFDELHRQRNSDLWDVLKYGMATRAQPLLFAITTAGITGESPICEQQHGYARAIKEGIFQDPSYYPVIYGLDEKEDWTNEGEPAKFEEIKEPDPMDRRKFITRLSQVAAATGWFKANPSLGHHLQLEKIREEFLQAQNNPSQQNSFRRLRLDQWVGQEIRYIPMDHWKQCGEPFNLAQLVGKPCFAGLDLSATQDITALVLAFALDGEIYLVPHFWLPEHELHLRSKRDKVTYDLWAAQGLIHTTPGDQVDYGFIRTVANDLAKLYDIREIGYDRWNATQIIQNLTDDGITMVPIGQGFASMSAPTKEMLRLIMEHKLRHNDNPILNWMADNFSVKQDSQDNVKPSKPDRRQTSKRIDGIQAAINAVARIIVTPEYKGSVYDTRGVLTDEDFYEEAF
jgi:phage terminase large subunit-like protein